MVAEALAGLSAFKTLFDLAKGLKDVSDAATRNAVAVELYEKIMVAHAAQSALLERVRDLEAQVASFKDWEAQEQRYELKQLRDGVFAYTLKEGVEPPEEPHHLCANCYGDRKKRVLQKVLLDVGRAEVLACNGCGAEIYVRGVRHEEHRRGRR